MAESTRKEIQENKEIIDPQLLASQLRKPSGEDGIELGRQMNESNKVINLNAYKRLLVEDGDQILEVGMGNGAFVNGLVNSAKNVHYTGVDYSPEMVQESVANNRDLIGSGKAQFHEGLVDQIPSSDKRYTKIVTINTLYFWDDPYAGMKELARVLKPEGKLLIAVRPKGTVKAEFTRYNFNFYEEGEILDFVNQAKLEVVEFEYVKEETIEFDGEKFDLESLFIHIQK